MTPVPTDPQDTMTDREVCAIVREAMGLRPTEWPDADVLLRYTSVVRAIRLAYARGLASRGPEPTEAEKRAFASLAKAYPVLVEHASHLDGEFDDALTTIRTALARYSDPDAVRRAKVEGAREALTRAGEDVHAVSMGGAGWRVNLLNFRDREYPAPPAAPAPSVALPRCVGCGRDIQPGTVVGATTCEGCRTPEATPPQRDEVSELREAVRELAGLCARLGGSHYLSDDGSSYSARLNRIATRLAATPEAR